MLNITIQNHLIHWDKEDKTFSTEASSLDLPARHWNSGAWTPVEKTVVLKSNKSGKSATFKFDKIETMSGGEEVGAWVYKSDNGLTLIIFND